MNDHQDLHRPPKSCPVCASTLTLTRLGCQSCGTELSGLFCRCEFCGLDDADRDLLTSFLTSRGNMKQLERHLGVSYPTVRARFDAMLERLGLQPVATTEPEQPGDDARLAILQALARNEIDVDEALRRDSAP